MTKKTDLKKQTVDRKPDGTVNFQIAIPNDEVKKAYNKTLSIIAQSAEIKGFRKGKAPASLVEEQIGKQKIYSEALQHILPKYYSDAVKKHNLKPISSPKIETKQLEENKDWQLSITIAEKPKVDLGNYKKAVSEAKTDSNIWVPGKDAGDKSQEEKKKESTDEKVSRVFNSLLSNIKFEVSSFLIEEEVNRQLSQLLDQVQKLGLTLDQYLASLNKSIDLLKKEYHQQAERNIRLEIILNEIANDMKIEVQESEIDQLINSVGDEKLKEKLRTPHERTGIRASIRKRKVLDSLLKL